MSKARDNERRARLLYEASCEYLRANGWEREEPGSGWWWREDQNDLLRLGEALDLQLLGDGIDLREEPFAASS